MGSVSTGNLSNNMDMLWRVVLPGCMAYAAIPGGSPTGMLVFSARLWPGLGIISHNAVRGYQKKLVAKWIGGGGETQLHLVTQPMHRGLILRGKRQENVTIRYRHVEGVAQMWPQVPLYQWQKHTGGIHRVILGKAEKAIISAVAAGHA